MNRRRGYALIELLMIIMTGSILMGLSAGLLHVLLKVDRSGRAHVAGLAREEHLARLFRADVRAARLARPAPTGSSKLTLDLGGDQSVEYRIESKHLLRIETVREAIQNQDTFPLPRSALARFEIEAQGPVTQLRLVIERAARPDDFSTRHTTQIESVVGQDYRFEAVEK